ncbi:MAG: hypothetical protein IPM35_15095 [Myxococcales bacterium]|nr:hypothetical protein [Myxococcales bacterium]
MPGFRALRRVVPVCLALAIGAPLAISACSDAARDTGGSRVELGTRVTAKGAEGFTNAAGWNVKLDRALVATGPLYYFEGAPVLARALGWLVGTAHAHPGHYQAGETEGEMLEEWSVDLLAGPAELPRGRGVTGTVRSATFSFGEEAAGPVAGELGGHVVLLEGTATKDASSVDFRALADVADVLDLGGKPLVEGCLFEEVELTARSTVSVEIDLGLWLGQVDFGALTPPAGGGVATLEPGTTPHEDFTRGLRKAASYRFSLSKETP